MLEANEITASLILVLNDWYSLGAGACGDARPRLDGFAGADWGRDADAAGTDWRWDAVDAVGIRAVGNAGFGSTAVEVIIGMVARLVDGDAGEEPPPILRSRGV